MANLNPIQIMQPVKGLNPNQSTNGDSQESFLDQQVMSFPDELEAAKGQSQQTSSSADSSDQKPELVETTDLQNLPVTAATSLVSPANIAAAIQVMAPVDASAIEIINLDQLQLAALAAQGASTPEQTVNLLDVPVLTTQADAQQVAQALVSEASLAVASEHIQETVAQAVEVAVDPKNIVSAHVSSDNQVVASDAVSVEVSQVNTPAQLTSAFVNQDIDLAETQQDHADLDNDLATLPGAVVGAQVLAANPQLVSQAVQGVSDQVNLAVDSNTQVSSVSQVSAGVNLPSVELTNVQVASSDVVSSGDLDASAQVSSFIKASDMNQGDELGGVSQNVVVPLQVDIQNTDHVAKLVDANQAQDMVNVTVAEDAPAIAQLEVASASQLQNSVPVIQQNRITNIAALNTHQSATPTVVDQSSIDAQATIQLTDTGATVEQVSVQSSAVADAKDIQVSRDDLAQSEDIIAARVENAKLAKLDTDTQVDLLTTVESKDLNKIDAVNNGMVLTDVNRSTFVANAAQELKLTQAAPIRLEPHHVSLSNGPLNVEVMRVLKEGGGRVIMEVTPPDQGTLQLDLRLDNQGKAILIVDGASDSTRARLEQGSAELRQQLADMGLQLSLNMRQKSDSEAQFRFAASTDGFNNSKNIRNDSSTLEQVGSMISNQINSDGRVHLYA